MEEMIEKKQMYETQIADVFKVYLQKYMKKLYDYVDRDLKRFKKVLVDISSWNEEKITKEYNKFLKWSGKKSIEEAELKNMLDNVIMYSIRLMINKYDTDVLTKLIEFESTNPERFFYKCMKRVAKFVYENPETETEMFEKDVNRVIISVIYEFLPIQKILRLLEVSKEPESEKSYDFNKTFTSESESDSPPLIVEKERESSAQNIGTGTGTKELHYVSSEDIQEYYQSDKEENNEKLINIQKVKKKKN
jgi:uncharacterized protein (UPF0254 family)